MTAFVERRTQQRRSVYYGAKAMLIYSIEPVDLIVRNLTEHGARLTLRNEQLLPTPFTIKIDRDDRFYTAKVIWKHGRDLGVRFSPEALPQEPSSIEASAAPDRPSATTWIIAQRQRLAPTAS